MHPFEGTRGAARSSAPAKIPGRLLERHGNMPSREMIIYEETVCKDTSPPDRTRLTGWSGTKNRPDEWAVLISNMLFPGFPVGCQPSTFTGRFHKRVEKGMRPVGTAEEFRVELRS
jgi:hypothetical protein